MKNLRIKVKVVENCAGRFWWYIIYINNRPTALRSDSSEYKRYVINAAEKMAKRIGIKYDPEIIKQHGC